MRSLRSTQIVVILAGYVMGALALYWGLPDVPPSWRVAGRGTLWLGAPMVAFLLPTAVAVTSALLRGLCVRHPIGEPDATNVLAILDAIMVRFSTFVIGVHAAVLLALMGVLSGRAWVACVVPLMLGVTMISIGNLLPRTRPNLAIGIRTQRTLSNRALWISTHRSAGYLLVACGAVTALSAIAVPGPMGPRMIFLVGPAVLVGTWLLVRSAGSRAQV